MRSSCNAALVLLPSPLCFRHLVSSCKLQNCCDSGLRMLYSVFVLKSLPFVTACPNWSLFATATPTLTLNLVWKISINDLGASCQSISKTITEFCTSKAGKWVLAKHDCSQRINTFIRSTEGMNWIIIPQRRLFVLKDVEDLLRVP